MKLRVPLLLRAYRVAMTLLARFMPGILQRRAARGKEDLTRLNERLGTAPILRPEGVLVWLHGASVGESMVALSVSEAMRAVRPDLKFLFTSGTKTSADIVGARLQDGDFHRYLPVDTPRAVKNFIAGWRPDVCVLVEGEIWPNLLLAARAAGIKTALINARMTQSTIQKWKKQKAAANYLFDAFDLVLPADERTKEGLGLLRSLPIGPVGNLKLAGAPPKTDLTELKHLQQMIGPRPIWLAASTHDGEDATLIMAHTALQAGAPDALLILAPRHIERTNDIEVDCRLSGIVPVRRSLGSVPTQNDPIWLWDTMGELALAMKLAPVTFMGGSLVEGVGGHNPVEPAQIGSAIISGACVHNFDDLYTELENAGGARIIDNPMSDLIAMSVAGLLGNEEQRSKEVTLAQNVVAQGAGAMRTTINALLSLLP